MFSARRAFLNSVILDDDIGPQGRPMVLFSGITELRNCATVTS